MSEFIARVRAELDVNSLRSQIESATKNQTIKLNVETNTSAIKNLKSQISSVSSNNIKINADTSSVKNAKSDFQILKNLANEISQKKIKIAGLDTSKNSNQIKILQSQLNNLESDYASLRKIFSGSLNIDQLGQLEQIFGKTSDRVEELKAKAKDLSNTSKDITKPFNILDATMASNKTLTWLNNNTKAAKQYGDTLKNLAERQRNATSNKELAGYAKEFRAITSEAKQLGLTGKTVFGELGRGFKQIGQFVGTYGIWMKAVDTLKKMVVAVKDVDDAMTDLRKVTDAPLSMISDYFDEATASAKKYGQAISDVIKNTADWQRLGYNLNESKQLSDMTTLYQNVGDNMTQEKASESMVSTLQGFQLATDQAEHIVDSFNEVGNNFAIGSDGIGEALQRSASSMYAAGNTLEETIGLVTAANEVVQDPASVGTAFKTISMRIRGAKTELEAMGEDTEGMADSTAKLREEIMALSGVDIMLDENTFKSTYQILGELSSKWQDLTDIQQASVTELIAGRRIYLYVQKCA